MPPRIADTPSHAPATLRAEREAGGIADASLDAIVGASRSVGKDVVHIPGGGSIVGRVFANVRQMHRAGPDGCSARAAICANGPRAIRIG